ncbi:MAG: DNA alkylation repair protein [Anaerolineaceae bacterium]
MPDYSQILASLIAIANPEKVPGMKAYMKNQFEYLGVQTPASRQVLNHLLPKHQSAEEIDWEFVEECWADPHRELQYAALSYLARNVNLLNEMHIPQLKELILDKSWWDTVDSIVPMVGSIVQKNPELKALMINWSLDNNIWIRRTSIEHQLSFKTKTDTDLLEVILINNFGSKEFFINKAIGWALRDYSWTNPGWVRDFIERHRSEMAPLSIREGGKYV